MRMSLGLLVSGIAVLSSTVVFGQLRVAQDAGAAASSAHVEKARQVLEAMRTDNSPEVREEAMTALGLAKVPDAKDALLKALKAPDGKQRFAAARGLAYLADNSTAAEVTEAFRKEDGWAVKKELAQAAVAVGAKELLPELRTATLAPQKDLAAAAAWALVDFQDSSGDAALLRLGKPERKGAFKEGSDRWARKVLMGKQEGDAKLATVTLAQYGKAEDAALLEKGLSSVEPKIRLWSAAGLLRLQK